MAFAFADMVQTTSSTTGTGDYVIDADAVGAFQSVEDGIGDGNWSLFSAIGSDGFEIFKGALSIAGAVHTLSRDAVYAGSNGTSKVNWGSGTRVIQCVAPAVVLSMLYDPTRTGFAVQTGATGMAGRTLAAGNGLSWTNADGVSGNPSLALVLDGASLAVTGSGLAIAALGVATGHLANGAVTQIKIADDAVDLTELAHATQGDILYWGASGVPARLGAGTAGQYLTTQGAGANPVWGDVPTPAIEATYTSGGDTPTTGATITLTHGLGGVPLDAALWLVCTSDELGYVAGERVLIAYNTDIGGNASRGIALKATSTQILIKMGSTAAALINFSTGAAGDIDPSKWSLVVTAWR